MAKNHLELRWGLSSGARNGEKAGKWLCLMYNKMLCTKKTL